MVRWYMVQDAAAWKFSQYMMDCNLFNLSAAYIGVQRTLLKTFPFISTYLPTQEVLKYTLEYASIVHAQKLYQVHLEESAKQDFLVLLQFD